VQICRLNSGTVFTRRLQDSNPRHSRAITAMANTADKVSNRVCSPSDFVVYGTCLEMRVRCAFRICLVEESAATEFLGFACLDFAQPQELPKSQSGDANFVRQSGSGHRTTSRGLPTYCRSVINGRCDTKLP